MIDLLAQMSVPWLLFVGTALLAGLRWGHLSWRDARREPQRQALRDDLHRLRDRVAEGSAEMPAGWRLRPVPALDTDRRLVLLHEDAPRQQLPRFPSEEAARTVMFADGRVEWFSESAFERLLVGDNVLRGRLDLPELDADGREE